MGVFSGGGVTRDSEGLEKFHPKKGYCKVKKRFTSPDHDSATLVQQCWFYSTQTRDTRDLP